MSITTGNKVQTVNMVNTVVQPVNRPVTRSSCTKEDIDRKRREALARRQMSQQRLGDDFVISIIIIWLMYFLII